jgi:4-nitrophenyl phosphatase
MTQITTIKSLILDLDGVIWRDHEPIGDLPAIFNNITKLGVKTAFATNNGSLTPDMYVERFHNLGVSVNKDRG